MANQQRSQNQTAEGQEQAIVYDACKNGRIESLKSILQRLSSNIIFDLIHAKTNGATPLIMAARNGHYEVVKYLIEECKADFTQPGCVKFDGETIEGAPPLWCAAAAGHLEIVEYLVEKGADVNQTTYTNSTPLRAACFDGHYAIVEFLVKHDADIEIANRHGHTCLMIACYKGHKHIVEYLLSLKAQVNRKSIKGNQTSSTCQVLHNYHYHKNDCYYVNSHKFVSMIITQSLGCLLNRIVQRV